MVSRRSKSRARRSSPRDNRSFGQELETCADRFTIGIVHHAAETGQTVEEMGMNEFEGL
jgi:hypothetical protein